ncbi:Fatty acid amide hydrolase, variant 2 [Clonorchis sinensis]|uniref:Fatty acid amide hydrolase, variant 2 n=2 Tax=Clonorchis sinensis TaxID=79923 RepID=A0A8T1MRE0_CLOSI|nr:Fatty acid amide hydrolase, variant 2 [Clonorchis sinensis]
MFPGWTEPKVNTMQKIKDLKKAQLQKNLEDIKANLADLKKSNEELLSLTELSLTELQAKLKHRAATPLDLLHAFQLKGLKLQEKGNSGICQFINEAEQQASQLTEHRPSIKSELFGIPISVKELLSVSGYDVTFGLWKLCQKSAKEDSVVIQVLKNAGAIPFVLTSTTQAAFTQSGLNPIFGNLWNPYSDKHEAGGSSCGEAVLLAQNGSPVGIGTDLAGSIRIPAVFCGLAGLKPTSKRLSAIGSSALVPQSTIELEVCIGPIGKHVDDLAKVMRTLLSPTMFELDPNLPVLPFNEEVYLGKDKRNLVIGFYETIDDSNIIQTVPSVRRAVEQAVHKLSQRGHTLIKFSPPKPFCAFSLGLRSCAVDGLKGLASFLNGEPLSEASKTIKRMAAVPEGVRPLIDAHVRKSIGKPAAVCEMIRKVDSVAELMEHVGRVKKYRQEFAKAWKEAGNLDAIICPVWAYPAMNISTPSHYITPSVIYVLMYNLLDYPAGSVPMGLVSCEDLEQAKIDAEKFKQCGDHYHEQLMNMQADTIGLPLGVQVVAKPFREELVLRIMSELENGHR